MKIIIEATSQEIVDILTGIKFQANEKLDIGKLCENMSKSMGNFLSTDTISKVTQQIKEHQNKKL